MDRLERREDNADLGALESERITILSKVLGTHRESSLH